MVILIAIYLISYAPVKNNRKKETVEFHLSGPSMVQTGLQDLTNQPKKWAAIIVSVYFANR